MMRRAFRHVSARADHDGVSLRVAAYEIGIERVLDAAITRGHFDTEPPSPHPGVPGSQ